MAKQSHLLYIKVIGVFLRLPFFVAKLNRLNLFFTSFLGHKETYSTIEPCFGFYITLILHKHITIGLYSIF